jgi:hypothetical protein
VIRPRGGVYVVLLLLAGLFGSVLTYALLLPDLAHLGPPAATTPANHLAIVHRGARHAHHGWLTLGHIALIFLVSAVLSVLAFAWWATRIIRCRLARRLTREYGLYEIRLSMHDQARGQDVTDMTEALLNAVRAFPEDRARDGQSFLAFEAHYAPGVTGEMEWLLCLRCESELVQTLDGIISSAYPDVRVGYEFTGPPAPVNGTLPIPGHVLRFRKARSFLYPSIGEVQDGAAARPLEAIAQTQAAVGRPSTVRFQMTPCALPIERYARERLRHHEYRLRTRDGGVALGELDRNEMTSAADAQSHTWCWLEVQVAAESRQTANRIAAALQGRRGANRLQRRWMILREDLYRRRFPTAYPPLLPALTLRTLACAGEVAHLIALPGARMKNVPVRRLALPRIPAPPEIGMAPEDPTPELPPSPSLGTPIEDR